jgi:hypothetical protein
MSETRIEYLQKNIERIDSIEKDKSEKFTQWIKHIITILVGLLTILVALKNDKTGNGLNDILFSTILSLLGTAIISGIIFLFHQIDEFEQTLKFQRESLDKRFKGDTSSVLIQSIVKKRVFKVAEFIFYISSVLTIILLVVYGIIK